MAKANSVAGTSSATLMTSGPIWKRLVAFAIPLFWGNLFQQFYNTADSVIVGNFLGNNALAAVSSSGNLIFLLVGFFNGIAIGAGVVTGKYFGAGLRELPEQAAKGCRFWWSWKLEGYALCVCARDRS